MSLLDEIRESMLGKYIPADRHVVIDGRFRPYDATPRHTWKADTVKRHLKAAGYAMPSPERDGYWLLTDKGREWLYGAPDSKGDA